MENNIMSYLFNDLVGFKDNAVDAFNRLKTSTPFTLFDSQNRYQTNDKWDVLTATGGTSGYLINESTVTLTAGLTIGSKVYRETKRVFPYQPGKSLLVLQTFTFPAKTEGLRTRIGYFGTQNGIYLEQNGQTAYFAIRSYTSGTADDSRKIAQNQWNIDTFDGNGPSGNVLDLTKTQIFFTDMEWLGVGSVRCGFFVDGKPVVAHRFDNDNIQTAVYMTTATLPMRTEIENLTGQTASHQMKQICSSVMSEAGYEGFSRRYNITKNGATPTTLTTAGTQYPIIAIRLNSNRLDSVIVPSNLSVVLEQAGNNKPDTIQYRILLNPTITGGSWITHYNGNVDYNITSTGITGGTDIIGGYISSNGVFTISDINDFNFQLGRTQAGVSDIFCLVFIPINNGAQVYTDLSWFEII
jgi:hypothetical protein